MRIAFVYQADYPWDVRVEKIVRVLCRAGHRVQLVSANEVGRARYEQLPEAEVHRLPHLRGKLSSLNSLVNFPFFLNPFWLHAIATAVRGEKADVIIVRDLPLALAALIVGRCYRVPVLMDMAECYPELLRNMWRFGGFSWVNLLARNPLLADYVEKISVRRLAHIFVMVEESRERLIRKGVEPGRLSIVSNTPPLEKFRPSGLIPEACDVHRPVRLVYAGWVHRGRGLDTVIEGLAVYVANYSPEVHLSIIGSGDAERELRVRCRELGLESVVSFAGWLNNQEVVEQILSSDVGLVPHHVTGHWDHTVPNKLFDYMAGGLSVLTSDTKPVARIVREAGCGLVYRDYSAEDFARQLKCLADPDLRNRLARAGRRAISERYNWEQDASMLLATIHTYERKGTSAT